MAAWQRHSRPGQAIWKTAVLWAGAVTIGLAPAAEPADTFFQQTASLAAPEAHQAAVADADSVYAIASRSIARFDRRSGERLATSHGEAEHLNSGFLWDGRILCAHSNHPHKPDRSDIRILDPATMQLSVFHDFGESEGSLTWVVHHEGAWWCNFAYYGPENARTYLARLDDDWNETGRWTYPAEVVAQWGRHSASGGVFLDGDLWITGHDDPLLFRLRLPKDGDVLELMGLHAVPFPGQGIAVDPTTGGLVGVDRRAKEVLFAERLPFSGNRLRVLSYNIHHGAGMDGRLDLVRIARVIAAADADLVSLQEVDRHTTRTGRVDQAAELARLLEMHHSFGPNIPLQGGEYGNAILSRFPIQQSENELLPCHGDGEQRGVLRATIDVPGWSEPIVLLATHFDHRRADTERIESARRINAWAAKPPEKLAILAGDLNDTPASATLTELILQWQNTSPMPQFTIPVETPRRQIDFILCRPPQRWTIVETRVIEERLASDHRPILSILEKCEAP